MGEVYAADDTLLRRPVATKLLLPHLMDSLDRVRFEREACAASSFNHPNILTIHELGSQGETHFIVTEFVDEQALLARVRYNRLVDIFLGIRAYSLQIHLRTNVKSKGQIEIDEIYVGVDRHGSQYNVTTSSLPCWLSKINFTARLNIPS